MSLIYKKLLEVQEQLKAPKSQWNKFGNYYYRSCEDILEGLKPALKEVGATVIVKDEIVTVSDRFYVKAIATFIDIDTGETVVNEAYAREADKKTGMDDSQVTGTASSYARKYALNGLFLIDDTKDDDTDEHAQQTGKAQSASNAPKQGNKAANSAKPNKTASEPQKAQNGADNSAQGKKNEQPEQKQAEQKQPEQDLQRKVTKEESDKIALLVAQNNIDCVAMLKAFGVGKYEDLTLTNYYQIGKNVESLKQKFPMKEEKKEGK